MQMIRRDDCVISGQRDLELLHRFDSFPIYMGCVDSPPSEDVTAQMAWWISRSSGCIQLNPLIPLDVLYQQGHGSGTVGELWRRHHRAFSEFVLSYRPRHILEIGGGHGILANHYLDAVAEAQWTMVEPNPTVAPRDRLTVIRGLVDRHFQADPGTDAVVHSHFLEHVFEPGRFFSLVAGVLQDEGCHFFSIPNLKVMLERKYTNCLNFEHTVFLTEEYVDHLLAAAGFTLQSKQYFMDDHSIFYAARKRVSSQARSLPRLYEWHRALFQDYVHHHVSLVEELNHKISSHKGDVFVFGAHVFTQYLLAFGLRADAIVSILDNDPRKQGHRMYGTELGVEPPSVLLGARSPAVILRAGIYNEEIKAGIRGLGAGPVTYWE